MISGWQENLMALEEEILPKSEGFSHFASLSVQDMETRGLPGASSLPPWGAVRAVRGSVPSPPSTFTLRWQWNVLLGPEPSHKQEFKQMTSEISSFLRENKTFSAVTNCFSDAAT